MMATLRRLPLSALAMKSLVGAQPVRHARSKPWHPKFKLMRHLQPFLQPTDLSKLRDHYRADGVPLEMFKRMQKDGFVLPSQSMDRMISVNDTGSIIEAYVPPEGDGKASLLSTARAGQTMTKVWENTKSYRHERYIRRYDEDFKSSAFAVQALELYKRAHDLLQNLRGNELKLLEVVTEKAFNEMTDGLQLKTFRWRFHESIEPPKAVHIRVGNILTEDNRFAQVTVRIFSKQSMAIYDRFGRPIYGSEDLVKDVLEYVVFEKHLANEYGVWRLHGKVVPDWMPQKSVYLRTMRMRPLQEEAEEEEEVEEEEQVQVVDVDKT